jgi:hypothetical protein
MTTKPDDPGFFRSMVPVFISCIAVFLAAKSVDTVFMQKNYDAANWYMISSFYAAWLAGKFW